jgi:hypothetical protein
MVLYNPDSLMQHPPPRCPKCGSHRSEIVGFSNDRQTVVIRCNACGERSKIQAAADEGATLSTRLWMGRLRPDRELAAHLRPPAPDPR